MSNSLSDDEVKQQEVGVQATQGALEGGGLQRTSEQELAKALKGRKPNTLGLARGDEVLAREVTKARYERMESVQDALTVLVGAGGVVDQYFSDGIERAELKELTRSTLGLYINPEQYHNAEHVLKVVADILDLAKKARLDAPVYKRLVITGLYHDAGNGRFPDSPGKDELEAVKILLRDIENSEPGSALVYLKENREEKIQVVANILGTVFPDRFASVEQLLDLLKAKNKFTGKTRAEMKCVDYVKDAAVLLGIESRELAERMVNAEAVVVKNTDIASSFKEENLLKNGFGNFLEDAQRPFSPFLGQRAGQYRTGFRLFTGSVFHDAWFQKEVFDGDEGHSRFLKEGRTGQYFLTTEDMDEEGAKELAEYGKKLDQESKAFFEKLIKNDGALLNAVQASVTEDVRAAGGDASKLRNILAVPLRDIPGMLEPLLQSEERIKKAINYDAALKGAKPEQVDHVRKQLDEAVHEMLELGKGSRLDFYFADDVLGSLAGKTIAELKGKDVLKVFGRGTLQEET